jgi:pentatricopeptide repeat protein
MPRKNLIPNEITYVTVIGAITDIADPILAKGIHNKLIKSNTSITLPMWNALIYMYNKAGTLGDVLSICHVMQQQNIKPNIITWNGLMTAYTQHGQPKKAQELLHKMKQQGIKPNAHTYCNLLQTCISLCDLSLGKRYYDEFLASQEPIPHSLLNSLFELYARCGENINNILTTVHKSHDSMWIQLLKIYIQHAKVEDVLQLLSVVPSQSKLTEEQCLTLITDSTKRNDLYISKKLHNHLQNLNVTITYPILQSLHNMYIKCGSLVDAKHIFNEMRTQNMPLGVVTWTAMISAHTSQGNHREALDLFAEMKTDGIQPNSITYTSILAAHAELANLDLSRKLYNDILQSHVEITLPMWNAIINMFGKSGALSETLQIFDMLLDKKLDINVVTWTSVISALVNHEQWQQALNYFDRMKASNVPPNELTYTCILQACAAIEDLPRVESIFMQSNKCRPSLSLYTALIYAFGRCRHEQGVFAAVEKLQLAGLQPDANTFLCLLSAGSILGIINVAKQTHSHMINSEFPLSVKIYNALISMYSKCGDIDTATTLFSTLQQRQTLDNVTWYVLEKRYSLSIG